MTELKPENTEDIVAPPVDPKIVNRRDKIKGEYVGSKKMQSLGFETVDGQSISVGRKAYNHEPQS